MKLIAGSYEKFIWGWQIGAKKGTLNGVFSYPAHRGPIKCLASCGRTLASGGSDDIIKVFDVNEAKDLGSLHAHTGSITSLQFFKAEDSALDHPTNLFSSSEDGTIGIWDTETWTHLKSLKHKYAVNGVAVHKSGRVGLAVDRSGHLKMWNLGSGRCSYTNKLASEATLIKFSPVSGEAYALVRGRILDVHDVVTGEVVHTYEHEKEILCMGQIEDSLIVSGGEDRAIKAWDNRSGKLAIQFQNAHKSRVKGLCALNAAESLATPYYFASASSDGSVKIWDSRLHRELENSAESIAAIETTTMARLTCLVSCGSGKKMESISLASVGGANLQREAHSNGQEAGAAAEENGVTAVTKGVKLTMPKKKKPSVIVEQVPTQSLKKRKQPKAGAARGVSLKKGKIAAELESSDFATANDETHVDKNDRESGTFRKENKGGVRKKKRKLKAATKTLKTTPAGASGKEYLEL